jgi:predicted DNA binding CopG/RHH family protein
MDNSFKFNEEELQILKDFENNEFVSIREFEKEKEYLEEAAKRTLESNKKINIKISSKDFKRIQKKALQEGLSYQSLISSIIHKFLTGKLREQA